MRKFLDLAVSLSPMDRSRLGVALRIRIVDATILNFGIKVIPSLPLLTHIHSANHSVSPAALLVFFGDVLSKSNSAQALPRVNILQNNLRSRSALLHLA